MKTTTQILETESFQCMPDGFDVLINKKWFSEEEIRHIINMLSKEEETESVDWEFQLKYKLFGEL